MPFVQIAFVASGLLVIVFGVPLWMRRVPPNGFYGLRVPATFKDEQVWYDANAASGRDLVVFGLAIIAAALVPPALGWSDESYQLAWGMTVALGAIVLTMIGWARANRMLRERKHPKDAPSVD
jgi:uncharacterized membrane protein